MSETFLSVYIPSALLIGAYCAIAFVFFRDSKLRTRGARLVWGSGAPILIVALLYLSFSVASYLLPNHLNMFVNFASQFENMRTIDGAIVGGVGAIYGVIPGVGLWAFYKALARYGAKSGNASS